MSKNYKMNLQLANFLAIRYPTAAQDLQYIHRAMRAYPSVGSRGNILESGR